MIHLAKDLTGGLKLARTARLRLSARTTEKRLQADILAAEVGYAMVS
jgi:hypothetical protein